MKNPELILGSVVIASIVGAIISSYFNFRNSERQRKVDQQKIFFEKTHQAFKYFDKVTTSHIVYLQRKMQQAHSYVLRINESTTNAEWIGIVDALLKETAEERPLSFRELDLNLFIDIESCKPSNFDKLLQGYNNSFAQLEKSLNNPTYFTENKSEALKLMLDFINFADDLAYANAESLQNVRKLIKQKFKF